MADKKLEKKEATIFTLEGSGKKLAFTNVNRAINRSIVNAKKRSIEEFGLLTPLTVMDASAVVTTGVQVFDANTDEEIPASKINDYLVVLDGQHRYKAVLELNKKEKYYDIWLMKPINEQVAITTMLMEINTTAINWKNDNYIDVLAKLNPNDKGLAFINKYMNMKYSKQHSDYPNGGFGLSVLSKYLTLSPKINKSYLHKMAQHSNKKLPDEVDVDRAERIIATGLEVGFSHRFLTSRYYIDWIIDKKLHTNHSMEEILSAIKSSITEEIAKSLKSNCTVENYMQEFNSVVKIS